MAEKTTAGPEGTPPRRSDDDGREYTAGTETLQKMERGFARAARRIAHGLAEGVRVYHEEGEKSADSKKDGATRDMFVNAAKGFSVAMTEIGKAPLEIAEATDTDAAWGFTQSVGRSVDRALRRESRDDEKTNDSDE